MSQSDLTIQNQSFPSFRSDLNDALSAINSFQSGTSRPASAVAGTIWLDITSATTPTLKYYDGADDISLATIDHSANTVNWLDSTVSADLVNDLTPQLGGMLDVNGQAIGDGTLELVKFSETASAVNEITIANADTNNAPEISATGDDTDIDLKLTPKGAGNLILDGFEFPNTDGTAGQVLQTDGYANLSFATPSGGANTPAFLATLTGTHSITVNAVGKVPFHIESFDTDSCYDHVTNYRFTPNSSGKYMIGATIGGFTGNSSTYMASIIIYKNGSSHISSLVSYASNGNEQRLNVHSVVEANGTTDYFEIYYGHFGSGSGNFDTNGNSFYGYKLIGV